MLPGLRQDVDDLKGELRLVGGSPRVGGAARDVITPVAAATSSGAAAAAADGPGGSADAGAEGAAVTLMQLADAGERQQLGLHASPSASSFLSESFDSSESEQWEIPIAELPQPWTKIGEGSGGVVFKATHMHSPVAVKVLANSLRSLTEEQQQQVSAEVSMLKHLRHANLVRFFGVGAEEGLFVVTELCAHKSLHDVLKVARAAAARPPRPPGAPASFHDRIAHNVGLRLKLALDAAKGMSYLHSRRIFHRYHAHAPWRESAALRPKRRR